MGNGFRVGALFSYLLSVIFIGLGFHKMFAYENPDSYLLDKVNAYVGGDAYNYIINGNYATAYFTLATLFVILGSFLVLMGYLTQKEKTSVNNNVFNDSRSNSV